MCRHLLFPCSKLNFKAYLLKKKTPSCVPRFYSSILCYKFSVLFFGGRHGFDLPFSHAGNILGPVPNMENFVLLFDKSF